MTAHAQPFIRSLTIERLDVFDRRHSDWSLAGRVMNALHVVTKEYIIEDELLFDEGDEVDADRLLELERNLRRTGLFSNVEVRSTVVSADSVDVTVVTQDRFSLRPAVLFGLGGGIANVGAKVDEVNLGGTATYLLGSGLYRTENDIGAEGMIAAGQRRLFRSEFGIYGSVLANKFRTDQALQVYKPFRTMATPWAMALTGVNAFGRDFRYDGDTLTLLPFTQRVLKGWGSYAQGINETRQFLTLAVDHNSTQRSIATSRQAYDNTSRILVGFSSIAQQFTRTAMLDGFETEDVQTGGWGSAIIGRVFMPDSLGGSMWYIGAEGEQSAYVTPEFYVFGKVAGGSGIRPGRARYTAVESELLGHYRLTPSLLVASRFRQETVWNWDAFHQLVLDNDAGLRGYQANKLTGDNRIVMNTEVRWMTDWRLWILGFSGVVFHDAGAVWNQGDNLTSVRLRHSLGGGIRIHNLKASGEDTTFRFDVAYNMDERRFTGLLFSVRQLFSAFGSHAFRAPSPTGATIDNR
ncbi:MAG: hypothetical protein FGM24_02260 [Candidatus Kapabacteria bacterium]|nr:hypothetical protein [Candidatus Kapabacteria bacterium]